MKNNQLASRVSQRGSFYTSILMFAGIIFLGVCAMKIAPAYFDNNVIKNAVGNLASTGELNSMTLTQLRTALMRTLNTNNIKDFNAQNVVITREGDQEFVDINYETRVHLFKNIDAVVTFSERFSKR